MIPKGVSQAHWQKPPIGSFKLNFNAAWKDQEAGVVFLIRDHDGGLSFQKDVANLNWAEALALMQSITWDRNNGWDDVVLEGDRTTIINRFNM